MHGKTALAALLASFILLFGCISSQHPSSVLPPVPSPPSPPVLAGGDRDAHGCIPSAGYSWCESAQKCYRQWEENCTGQLVGNDRDAHGCIPSAGYSWCESAQKCYRPWEENCTAGAPCTTVADCGTGAARCVDGACTQYDEHGCVPDGGYTWCEEKQKCLRVWEEACNGSGRLANAEEHCSDENAAQVSVCGQYVKVVSSLTGGGSTFYDDSGKATICPLVAPDSMSDACRLLMMGSNCVEQAVDCSKAGMPGAVSDLADDPGFAGAQLSWSAPDKYAVDYEIFRADKGMESISLIKTTGQTSYDDVFDSKGATFAYFVRARNAAGAESPVSNIIYVQQLSTSSTPSPGQIN